MNSRIEQEVKKHVNKRYETQPKLSETFYWLWNQLEEYDPQIECRKQERYIGFYANEKPKSIFAYLDTQKEGLCIGIFSEVANQLSLQSLVFGHFPKWNSRGLTGIMVTTSNMEAVRILKQCHYASISSQNSSSQLSQQEAIHTVFKQKVTEAEKIEVSSSELQADSKDTLINADLEGMIFEQETLEGNRKSRYVNIVERDPKRRAVAVAIHGLSCMICGFNFEKTYGELGSGYIEVHHLNPLGLISNDEGVATDPQSEMAVVCSNCHRIIHRHRDRVIEFEELKAVVEKLRSQNL